MSNEFTKQQAFAIYRDFKNGFIPLKNLHAGIFEHVGIDKIIEIGMYWEEWDDIEFRKLFDKLENINSNTYISYDVDGNKYIDNSNSSFTKLANVFFPNMAETKSDRAKSLLEVWNDLERMTLVYDRFIKDRKMYKWDDKDMRNFRQFVRSLHGSYFAYNFKPDVAKTMYELYGNSGKVFDFSMGWGARLVGFMASTCKEYVGVDVNRKNFPAYFDIYEKYKKDTLYTSKSVSFYNCPAEDFKRLKYKDYFDLSFSSPPYFLKEIYSKDAGQHNERYKGYDAWIEGFLNPMLENQYYMIKKGGFLAVNIADVKIKHKPYKLEEPTINACKELGFTLHETLRMKINKSPFTRGRDVSEKVLESNPFKFENIYIFKK
jgi:hypothetical protein